MKHLILTLALIIAAGSAQASGKLSLQNNFYNNGTEYRPLVGVAVYERLAKTLALNSWVGYGVQPLEIKGDVNWLVAKAQVDMEFSRRWTVAPGVQYKTLLDDATTDLVPYIKVDLKLW